MTNTLAPLRWGQNQVLPDNATAAWGARLIVTQDGYVDIVPDRIDATGDEDAVCEAIDTRFPLPVLRETLSELLRHGWMSTRVGEDFTLYLDEVLTVHANTNGSAGYCYVTAWLAQ